MKSVDFEGAIFDNVVFICMSIDKINHLPESGYIILNKYPQITHQRLLDNALALSQHNQLYKYHVLNINKNKVNQWYLYLLTMQYSSCDDVARGLFALGKRNDKKCFITLASYKNYLDKYLKV